MNQNDSYTRILLSVFSVCLVTFSSAMSCCATQKQIAEDVPFEKDLARNSIFICLIDSKAIDVDFFLAANGILAQQESKMKALITRSRKELLKAYQRKNDIVNPLEGNDGGLIDKESAIQEIDSNISQVHGKFLAELERILAPHQIERMRQISWQRKYFRMGLEYFQLPLVFLKSLGLSEAEARTFREHLMDVSKSFAREKMKFRREAWEKLRSKLPTKVVEAMDEQLGAQIDDETLRGEIDENESK